MRNPFGFFTESIHQPLWISAWVFFLMVVNVASMVFWSEPLAKAILVIFLINPLSPLISISNKAPASTIITFLLNLTQVEPNASE